MGPVVTFLVASANWDHDYLYYMEIWSLQRVAKASYFRYETLVVSVIGLGSPPRRATLITSATWDLSRRRSTWDFGRHSWSLQRIVFNT